MTASASSNTLPLWGTLRQAFRAYRKHARWVLGLGLLEMMLLSLTGGVFGWAVRSQKSVLSWVVIGLLGLLLVVLAEVVRGAASLQVLEEKKLSWRSLVPTVKRVPQYILTIGMLMIPVLVVTFVIGAVVLLMASPGSLQHLGEFPGWKISVLVTLELVWLLLLGWFWFSFQFTPYVIFEGATGLWKPISTSWKLLMGKKRRLLGAYVLAFGVAVALVVAPFLLLRGWVQTRGVDASLRASWLWIPTCIASGLLSVLAFPWLGVVQAAFYRVLTNRENSLPTRTPIASPSRASTSERLESTEHLLKRYEEAMKPRA